MYWKGKQDSDNFRQMLHSSPPESQVAAQAAVDELVQTLLSVENVVPNTEDLVYSSGGGGGGGGSGEEARARRVLDHIYTQQMGHEITTVDEMLAANGKTAMEVLHMIIPDDSVRNQMMMMHDSLGDLMGGQDFDEDEDY